MRKVIFLKAFSPYELYTSIVMNSCLKLYINSVQSQRYFLKINEKPQTFYIRKILYFVLK
jgi:hypothetical protein